MTDHFYDSRIANWQWQRAKSLKEDHGFMGRMSFPEDLDRPCRTIMATRSTATRESMIFGAKKKGNRYLSYRLPTIREIASIMSFPITYQFEANNEASKYRLVGNAVCPLQARVLAKAILEEEDMMVPNKFIPVKNYQKVSYDLTGLKRKKKQKCSKIWSTKFTRHIPYLKMKGFRVELDNMKSDFKRDKIIWSSVLHQGSGKGAFKCECTTGEIEKLINKNLYFDKEIFNEFKKDIIMFIDEKVPDAEELQKRYCIIENSNQEGPNEILNNIRSILDNHFPEKEYSQMMVKNYNDIIEIPRQDVPLRIIMGYYALNKIIDNVN
jgi:DNA (cytosine-5)-methyltransferase 1